MDNITTLFLQVNQPLLGPPWWECCGREYSRHPYPFFYAQKLIQTRDFKPIASELTAEPTGPSKKVLKEKNINPICFTG